MKTSVKEEVLKKIRDTRLTPMSRWYFISRNYFFWLLFVVSVVVGSLAFSSILFNLILETAPQVSVTILTLPQFFLSHTPIIWLLFVVMFSVSAWFNLRRVDGGHRTSHVLVFLASILFSLLLGLLLFYTGLSSKIEWSLRENVPIYRSIIEDKLEEKADYLSRQGVPADKLRLERERLRSQCIEERDENCFD